MKYDDFPEATTVYTDAFGGRILHWQFGAEAQEQDEELAGAVADRMEQDVVDNLEEDEDEENARAVRKHDNATEAHLVIHANGSEVWTHSGIEFAKAILHSRVSKKRRHQEQIFE